MWRAENGGRHEKAILFVRPMLKMDDMQTAVEAVHGHWKRWTTSESFDSIAALQPKKKGTHAEQYGRVMDERPAYSVGTNEPTSSGTDNKSLFCRPCLGRVVERFQMGYLSFAKVRFSISNHAVHHYLPASRLDDSPQFSKLSQMSFKPLIIAGRGFRSRLTSGLPGGRRGVLCRT